MADEYIVRYVGKLDDGTHVIQHPDGRLERRKSKTNWKLFDSLTDEDIERAIADDPDWADFIDVDWSKAKPFVPPNKTPISIRLDPDVLTFFKQDGDGYQKRINAVLRSFMQEKLKVETKIKTVAKVKTRARKSSRPA